MNSQPEKSTKHPIAGGCLCGAVRFEIRGPFRRAGFCHCSRCRRHSGTGFCVQGRVAQEDFTLLQGNASLRVYGEQGVAAKVFCIHCGSSVFGGSWPEGSDVSIRLGCLDTDPGIRPQYHTFVDSKASWDEIHDDLPRYPGALPKDLR